MKLNLNKGTKYKFMYAFDLSKIMCISEKTVYHGYLNLAIFVSYYICPPKYNTKSEREKSEGFLN